MNIDVEQSTCPHGYPIHLRSECPDCKLIAQESTGSDMSTEEENEFILEMERGQIEKMRPDLEKILGQLKSEIDTNAYNLVMGIDGSGRLPALVMGKFLKGVYHEGSDVDTKFIAGQRGVDTQDRTEQIGKYFEGLSLDSSKKVLLVESTISTGQSIKPMCDALAKLGIKFDIASLGFLEDYDGKDLHQMQEFLGAEKLAIGKETVSEIDNNVTLSGVEKKSGSNELFAHAYRDAPERTIRARKQAYLASVPLHRFSESSVVLLNTAVVVSRPVNSKLSLYSGVNTLVPIGKRDQGFFTPADNKLNFPIGASIALGNWGITAEADLGKLKALGVALSRVF